MTPFWGEEALNNIGKVGGHYADDFTLLIDLESVWVALAVHVIESSFQLTRVSGASPRQPDASRLPVESPPWVSEKLTNTRCKTKGFGTVRLQLTQCWLHFNIIQKYHTKVFRKKINKSGL